MARRIRARLDELGMTGRELARHVGHGDAWATGIKKGTQAVSLDDLDAVAQVLNLSPSELVRHDDAEMRELAPHEMRLLKHYQQWPRDTQDRWLAMLDYFASTVPDKATAALLDKIRATPPSLRRPILNWLERLLEEGLPPEIAPADAVLAEADESNGLHTKRRALKGRR